MAWAVDNNWIDLGLNKGGGWFFKIFIGPTDSQLK